ncbi:MAG: ribbon-helix-helix protein, CopG family [Gemmatimonadota bacterium]|nr:ribbon-helix-helix protein, CopG family [Gemmatimonadota bacterium]
MPRTTLKLEDDLLRRLKEKAAREGRTLQSVVNDLLRQGLTVRRDTDYRLRLLTWEADPQPGVDLFDRDTLFDRMEER